MFLACPLKAILDSDSEDDSDSDSDGGDAMGKGRRRIKRKSAKNIDWPTYDDQASFNEEAGSKLQSLIQIVKYHLVDDDRRPAHPSPTISKVMVFPDPDTQPKTPPVKKIMVFYNFTCMTATLESVSPFTNCI